MNKKCISLFISLYMDVYQLVHIKKWHKYCFYSAFWNK